jgi:hypothetical protein
MRTSQKACPSPWWWLRVKSVWRRQPYVPSNFRSAAGMGGLKEGSKTSEVTEEITAINISQLQRSHWYFLGIKRSHWCWNVTAHARKSDLCRFKHVRHTTQTLAYITNKLKLLQNNDNIHRRGN